MKPLQPENDFSPTRLAKSIAIFAASGPVLLAGYYFLRFIRYWYLLVREIGFRHGFGQAGELVRMDVHGRELAEWGVALFLASTPGALLGVFHYVLVRSDLLRKRVARKGAGLGTDPGKELRVEDR